MIIAPMFPSDFTRFSCDEEKEAAENTHPEPPYPEPPFQMMTMAPAAAAARMPTESNTLFSPPDSPAMLRRSSLHHNDLSNTMALIEQQIRLNTIAAAALANAAPTDWLSSQLGGSDEHNLRRNSNLNLPQIYQQQQQLDAAPPPPGGLRSTLIEQQARLNTIAAAALTNAAPTDWLSSQLGGSDEQNSHLSLLQLHQQQQVDVAPLSPARATPSKKYQLTENDIRPMDVLCGRGGKSNNHPGNKHYRQVVAEMREKYRDLTGKKQKTGLGYSIVDYIEARGGRFLKRNGENMYTVLNKAEARRKASQALRETKELKWTI